MQAAAEDHRPPGFDSRELVIESGHAHAYDEAEWRDALVVVERGEIELECLSGGRYRFADGDVLWLAGLPLRALHSCGREPALLLAVSRRRAVSFEPRRSPTFR